MRARIQTECLGRVFKCHRRFRLRGAVLAAVAVVGCGCGSHDSNGSEAPRVAVLSAFPAELAPNLQRATVSDTIVVESHVFRVGVFEGVPVVLAMTGIGLVNAAATTRTLLDRFDISGVVVSAVAGSGGTLQIGDVAVPVAWAARDGTTYAADQRWLELAGQIAAPGVVALQHCTLVPSASEEPVCLRHDPAIVVGGVGQSNDPFGSNPFLCQPGGDDLFGCDVDVVSTVPASRIGGHALRTLASPDTETPTVQDMETAAIASAAAARHIPFIAFRAVSDGPGDPLLLPNFLAQFSAYYRLAARNAAAATAAFLERVAAAQ